jgi:hypothetical protein
MPRIVYIAGYGRSGSTILDVLLGNHREIFGGGELHRLFDEWAGGHPCSCGCSYDQCSFWSQVGPMVREALPELSLPQAHVVSKRVESLFTGALGPFLRTDRHRYARLWDATLEAVSETGATDIIVDSSKSTRKSIRRAQALVQLCGFEVQVIHLVRDPRAVMWSILRGSNRALGAGQRSRVPGGAYRALANWVWTNALVHVHLSRSPRLHAVRVRYEDMVSRPVHVVSDLGSFLDVDMEPVLEMLRLGRPLDPGHGVAGNRLRAGRTLQLRADEEWRAKLPGYARTLAMWSWPLARRYGYDVLEPLTT